MLRGLFKRECTLSHSLLNNLVAQRSLVLKILTYIVFLAITGNIKIIEAIYLNKQFTAVSLIRLWNLYNFLLFLGIKFPLLEKA